MRNFLQDITIVGALLVSRCGEVLHYSVPDLLKYCDKILLMMDNEDEETRQIAREYQKKYPEIVKIAESGFPRATVEQENAPGGLFSRFRPLQSAIRDKVFKTLHKWVEEGQKIDIIFFPDSDEVFTASFPEVLTEFWQSEKKGLYSKHVSVYDKTNILIRKSQPGDVIAYKYDSRLSALPYRCWQIYEPLTKKDLFPTKHIRVHLAYLTTKKRDWRKNSWRPDPFNDKNKMMWFLPKDIRDMTSEEIQDYFKNKKPDTNIDDYERNKLKI